MKIILILLLFISLVFSENTHCDKSDTKHYIFGMTPWADTKFTSYMSYHIQKHTKDECFTFTFKSSTDFQSLISDAINSKYDFLELPSHIASFLILNHGFSFVGRDNSEAYAIILMKKGAKFNLLSDIKTLGVPPSLAIVHMVLEDDLKKKNLKPTIKTYRLHNQILENVLKDEIDAGIVYSEIYTHLNKTHKNKFAVLKQYPSDISGLIISRKGIPLNEIRNVQNILIQSSANTKRLFKRQIILTETQLEDLHKEHAPYVKKIKKLLGTMLK